VRVIADDRCTLSRLVGLLSMFSTDRNKPQAFSSWSVHLQHDWRPVLDGSGERGEAGSQVVIGPPADVVLATPTWRPPEVRRPDGCPRRWNLVRYPPAVGQLSRAELDELVAEAVVDANGDDEQLTGLFAMIEDNLAVPFETTVLGVEVTVRKVDLRADEIVAICHRGRDRQAIGILDLPLPDPAPVGAQWVAAYRHWAGQ
jgi:hypothetical protein